MKTVNVRLYEIFKQDFNLSDSNARELTHAVETVAVEKAAETFEAYKSSIREDLLKMELKLEAKIAECKIDMLKWFVGGFITIVIMLLGLFATIILQK